MEKILSVIIPAHEHPATLERCLSALSSAATDDLECIVIDDASPFDISSVVARFPVKSIRFETRKGCSVSRNAGAAMAGAPWLLFLDADCLITSSALDEIKRIIQSRPEEVAFFGSYDDQPSDPSAVSQFRNLLHHHFHQTGPALITTFWTGCGAIRKDIFLAMEGFDPVDTGIRDIDLGYRLTRAGYQIRLYPHIQVKHLKRWTLRKMIVADITKRGMPWASLLFQYGLKERNLNLQTSQKIAAAGVVFVLCGWLLSFWKGAFLWLGLFGFALFLGLNVPVLKMFASKRGVRFLVWAIPLLAVYYLSGIAGLMLGTLDYWVRRLRRV
jgi:glycosyltransferase involved in cell wall biosynthesis